MKVRKFLIGFVTADLLLDTFCYDGVGSNMTRRVYKLLFFIVIFMDGLRDYISQSVHGPNLDTAFRNKVFVVLPVTCE